MKEFNTFHPIVNFTYFIFAFGFSMLNMHPVCMAIGLISVLIYAFILTGTRDFLKSISLLTPIIIITAFINPLFSHAGISIIAYFPDGNPLTMESIYFGIAAALMIFSALVIFICFNRVITSEKFVYLFARIIPSLSLVLSMSQRFIPEFIKLIKETQNAQKCIGRDYTCGSLIKRMRCSVNILSIALGASIENAVDTANSMKARGYSSGKRTSFSIYKISKRDITAEILMLMLSAYIIWARSNGLLYVRYFPSFDMRLNKGLQFSVFFAYFALFILPVIVEVKEEIKWKLLKSKI